MDSLRAVEGTKVAALARELVDGDGRWKVSLRSSDGDVDVSLIARAAGGGGHKAAAGVTTAMAGDELVAFLADQVRGAALIDVVPDPLDGIVLADKPAGKTSHDVTTLVRRTLGVRKAGHAGTLDPFATGLLIVLLGRARRVQRFFTALPKEYVAVAQFGAVSTTGDPDGVITPTGVLPGPELPLPTGLIRQRPPAYSAIRVGGVKAYERARSGRGRRDARARGHGVRLRAALARGRPRGISHRVFVRDLRAQPHRRPRRRLHARAAPHPHRAVRRRRRGRRARPAVRLDPRDVPLGPPRRR